MQKIINVIKNNKSTSLGILILGLCLLHIDSLNPNVWWAGDEVILKELDLIIGGWRVMDAPVFTLSNAFFPISYNHYQYADTNGIAAYRFGLQYLWVFSFIWVSAGIACGLMLIKGHKRSNFFTIIWSATFLFPHSFLFLIGIHEIFFYSRPLIDSHVYSNFYSFFNFIKFQISVPIVSITSFASVFLLWNSEKKKTYGKKILISWAIILGAFESFLLIMKS